jgi:hypothetical protein
MILILSNKFFYCKINDKYIIRLKLAFYLRIIFFLRFNAFNMVLLSAFIIGDAVQSWLRN